MGVLAAPVAIARWIAERSPELADKALLRILVVGAEKLDAIDCGRWYQLLPVLLGGALKVRVTLVGDRLDAQCNSPARACAPETQAQCHVGSLTSFFASARPGDYDIALVFHPGFQKHQGWLRDSSLAGIISAGVPLIAASYESDEYEMDRWVVECHGFSVRGEALLNPFYLDFSDAGAQVRWGRALWQFAPRVPAPGNRIDTERLARLEQLARMVMHTIALKIAPSCPYGAMIDARASNGASRKLIFIFDDYFVDPADAGVLALRAGELDRVALLPAAELLTYPVMSAPELDRAVWAAGIKERYLMHLYPVLAEDQSRDRLARSMHTDLEEKIDALLRAS